MKRRLSSPVASALTTMLAAAVMTAGCASSAWASSEKVLHRFPILGTDGKYPTAALISDSAGNLYGTTDFGGAYVDHSTSGTVFRLAPNSNGSWTETILYSFTGAADGGYPYSSLVFDSHGALYGTTYNGGDMTDCNGGCGVVFKLEPHADGTWTESVLHTFVGTDGENPLGPLTFDPHGNLYGTTSDGGVSGGNCWNGCGFIFEMSAKSGGTWDYNIIYSFQGTFDAGNPQSQLVFDKEGNLYGTAGWAVILPEVVFELTPASGSWTFKLLHTFEGCPGCDLFGVMAGLGFDSSGNLYGAVPITGKYGAGFVYELSPTGDTWKFSVLYDFTNKADGGIPYGTPIVGKTGALYGTTYGGGNSANCFNDGCGVVYELSPASGETWSETTLYSFKGDQDGDSSYAGLLQDSAGNLYGTTYYGATDNSSNPGYGVVFEVRP